MWQNTKMNIRRIQKLKQEKIYHMQVYAIVGTNSEVIFKMLQFLFDYVSHYCIIDVCLEDFPRILYSKQILSTMFLTNNNFKLSICGTNSGKNILCVSLSLFSSLRFTPEAVRLPLFSCGRHCFTAQVSVGKHASTSE